MMAPLVPSPLLNLVSGMRCHICNRRLNTDEVKQGRGGKWEPCTSCINAATDPSILVTSKEVEDYLVSNIHPDDRDD